MDARKNTAGYIGAPSPRMPEPPEQSGLRMAYYALAVVALVIVLLCALTSCSSSKKASRRLVDSVVIHMRDSIVYSYKDSTIYHLEIKDSINIHDSVVIVMDEAGNIKSKEKYRSMDHVTDRQQESSATKDTIVERNASTDSMVSHEDKEEITNTPKLNWLQRFELSSYPLVIIFICAVYLWLRFKKKL